MLREHETRQLNKWKPSLYMYGFATDKFISNMQVVKLKF